MNEYLKNRQESEENFFCRFTFGQFFALLVLEVFTIFFVFYLGARYGEEFLGFDKKPTVVGEEIKVPTTADKEVADMARDIVEKAKTPELKERLTEMLKRAQETNPPAGGETVKPSEAAPKYEEAPPAQDTHQTSANDNSMPMRQAQAENEVERGVVRIKSAENAKYSLQIGSYPNMSEANASVERWKAKGYSAYLMIADIPDRGRWYRVRLGGFSSREEAKKYQGEFENQESVDTLIVMNEQ